MTSRVASHVVLADKLIEGYNGGALRPGGGVAFCDFFLEGQFIPP